MLKELYLLWDQKADQCSILRYGAPCLRLLVTGSRTVVFVCFFLPAACCFSAIGSDKSLGLYFHPLGRPLPRRQREVTCSTQHVNDIFSLTVIHSMLLPPPRFDYVSPSREADDFRGNCRRAEWRMCTYNKHWTFNLQGQRFASGIAKGVFFWGGFSVFFLFCSSQLKSRVEEGFT